MLIGAHVSIAGGIDLAIERGTLIGANCIQTFASSPRSVQFVPIPQDVIDRYLAARKSSQIECHVFHGIYLINLAGEKSANVHTSIESLIHYQQTAALIGVMGTIFHVGSHKGSGFDTVKDQVAQALVSIVAESPDNVVLMLENAAGHSGTIGQSIDELAELMNQFQKFGGDINKLGLCLDTQHAFASGIDGRDEQALSAFLDEIEFKIGLNFVKVIHLNDSKVEFSSHRDRHENIGAGLLGPVGIASWLNHPKLKHLPFILEVPGVDKKGPDAEEIKRVHALWKS